MYIHIKVRENPSGDFRSMYRHISKGSWTFSDRDHGWQVSDCTAENLLVFYFVFLVSKKKNSITNFSYIYIYIYI